MSSETTFQTLQSEVLATFRSPISWASWLYDSYIWTGLYSTNIFETEWDLCVILDACRVDLARTVSEQREWLPEPDTIWSVGSNSPSWYRRTIRGAGRDQIEQTALVSGNPHTNTIADAPWHLCDEVWTYAFNEEYGTILPRPVTDRAITVAREQDAERLLVHYMQPHLPPVQTSVPELGWNQDDGNWHRSDPWVRAAEGELDPDYVERLYRGNINPVLDDVELLLDNVNADRAVITADHGNYIGEDGKWSHPDKERGAPVRQVPWWETSATDRRTHEPEIYDRSGSNMTRMEQLKALGYQ